jgi:integrase
MKRLTDAYVRTETALKAGRIDFGKLSTTGATTPRESRRLAIVFFVSASLVEWSEAAKAAGFPDRIPHDFRRTAARNMERAGVPRSVAMALGGWRSELTYRRYAIASEADLRDGVSRLASFRKTVARVHR